MTQTFKPVCLLPLAEGSARPLPRRRVRESGTLDGLRGLQQQLDAKLEMKMVVVCHSGHEGAVTEGRIPNQIIRATDEGWQYEANQRHVDIVIANIVLQSATPVGTAGADEKKDTGKKESDDEVISPELGAQTASQYRGLAALATYVGRIVQTYSMP